MNQVQRNFASNQLKEIYKRRGDELLKRHTTQAKKLGEKEKSELIKNGKVKFKADIKEVFGKYTYIFECFDFSKFESEEKIHQDYYKEYEKLRLEKNSIDREIMLGDGKKVQSLLEKFDI